MKKAQARASVIFKAHGRESKGVFRHPVLEMKVSVSRSDGTNLSCRLDTLT